VSPSSATTSGALLLSDTSVLCAFCRAGAGERLKEHLEGRVWVVDAVQAELERHAERLPNLQRLLVQGWPPMIELPAEVRLKVADALTARAAPGRHPNEDEGEIATVLYADYSISEGTIYHLLLDDKKDGKKLAQLRGYAWTDTPGLVVEMVCADILDFNSGRRVWREAVSSSPRSLSAYSQRVETICPERVPAKPGAGDAPRARRV